VVREETEFLRPLQAAQLLAVAVVVDLVTRHLITALAVLAVAALAW
jgi:hypothetical protein